MTMFWISGDEFYTMNGATASPLPRGEVIYLNAVRWVTSEPVRSPMYRILDDFRAMLAKARAPRSILVAAIRDALRCVPRLAAALPTSRCSSRQVRRPRRRDIRHGDALLNVHRMPA